MKNYKNKQIGYTRRYAKDEDILMPEIKRHSVTMNHTKRFHNCLYLLCGLNPCSRNLMDYLTETMSEKNIVRSDYVSRQEFIGFMSNITEFKIVYGHEVVKKSFKKLSDAGLLIPIRRGAFMVNPEYFFRNDDAKRIEMIKMTLEFEKFKDTKLEVKVS